MVSGRQIAGQILSVVVIMGGVLTGTLDAGAETAAPSQAFLDARAAYEDAWNQSDLAFTQALFTEGEAAGYARYNPRETAAFTADDTLTVYAEPVGYAFKESDGFYSYSLTAGYRLLTLSGQVLAEDTSFATFTSAARTPRRELSASLSFQFGGLPAGDYRLETRFSDDIGGDSASFMLPFTVTAAQ